MLDFSSKGLSVPSAIVIASLIGVNASLTFCNLRNNQMDVASAQLLVAAVKDKDVSLASIKPDQTERDFSHKNLRPPDTVLLASDLSKPGVSASLTKMDLSYNDLDSAQRSALCNAVKGRSGITLKL